MVIGKSTVKDSNGFGIIYSKKFCAEHAELSWQVLCVDVQILWSVFSEKKSQSNFTGFVPQKEEPV